MTFHYDDKLLPLLAQIEEFLVSKTPEAVANLNITEPVYAVFLWYFDSSVFGGDAPIFGVGVNSIRKKCEEMYDDHASVCDCVWRPYQNNVEPLPRGTFNDRTYLSNCNKAYALMLAANKTGLPLEDEGEILRPFRSMMYRVAMRLNQFKWSDLFETTEEFVVVATESIGYWQDEDFKSSMPERNYKLLEQRKLIYEGEKME